MNAAGGKHTPSHINTLLFTSYHSNTPSHTDTSSHSNTPSDTLLYTLSLCSTEMNAAGGSGRARSSSLSTYTGNDTPS